MMPSGMIVAATPAEEEQEEKKLVKTEFTVKLTAYDDTKKIALIKEVKNVVEGLNLVQV